MVQPNPTMMPLRKARPCSVHPGSHALDAAAGWNASSPPTKQQMAVCATLPMARFWRVLIERLSYMTSLSLLGVLIARNPRPTVKHDWVAERESKLLETP
mmetsp:Transcript_30564/g.98462  ORF Transcript_30564/g.98462 Transcript_30564/m.98462 type:complete len:100 (+) Transcript_30564:502-801(+)